MTNPNKHVDLQLQEFINYFNRMEKEASREDYKRMLQDLRDTIEIRLKALKRSKK